MNHSGIFPIEARALMKFREWVKNQTIFNYPKNKESHIPHITCTNYTKE